jgi:hypothetical protein
MLPPGPGNIDPVRGTMAPGFSLAGSGLAMAVAARAAPTGKGALR